LLFAALLQPSLALEAEQNQAALAVEASNGQSTFHIGERVPLKLTFSSPNETEYLIAPLIRGRGGEFDCNRFEVVRPCYWMVRSFGDVLQAGSHPNRARLELATFEEGQAS